MSDLDPTTIPDSETDDDTLGHQAGDMRRLAGRVRQAVAECNDATRRLTSLEGMPEREPAYPGRSYFTAGDDDDVEGHAKLRN